LQNGKQSSDLVVAFFVPEWAERPTIKSQVDNGKNQKKLS